MYAVIRTGGKQYRVQAGDVLVVDKLLGEPGAGVRFDDVLMLGDGDAVVVGAPTVAGAAVEATLIETRKGDKIKVFKKIRRQGYRRTQGHRQHETVLRVTAIAGEGKSDTWDGEVDLTPRSALNARARALKIAAAEYAPAAAAEEKAPAKASKAKAAKAVTPKAVEVETVVAEEHGATIEAKVVEHADPVAEAPKKAAKPKAPKAEAAADEAEAPAAKPKAKKAKPADDGGEA